MLRHVGPILRICVESHFSNGEYRFSLLLHAHCPLSFLDLLNAILRVLDPLNICICNMQYAYKQVCKTTSVKAHRRLKVSGTFTSHRYIIMMHFSPDSLFPCLRLIGVY